MQEVATYIYNHYSERLILEDVAKNSISAVRIFQRNSRALQALVLKNI